MTRVAVVDHVEHKYDDTTKKLTGKIEVTVKVKDDSVFVGSLVFKYDKEPTDQDFEAAKQKTLDTFKEVK